MTDNGIRQAIDGNLSEVHVSQRNVNHIMRSITEGRKVKKKISVGLALALILLLAAVTALAATMVSGYLSFLRTKGSPTSAVTVNDTLYTMTNQGLMVWRSTDEDAQMEMSSQALQEAGISIDSLLFADDGLALLDTDHEAIWAYNNGEPQIVLDYHDTGVDFGEGYIASIVYQDDALFLLAKHETETTLYRWNIDSNTLETMPAQGIISIANYRQNMLLGIQRDFDTGDSVVSVDTQSGNAAIISTLPLLGVSGVAYSQQFDAIYAMVDGSLQCFSGNAWQVVRERSVPSNSFYFAVLDNGYVAVSLNGAQYVTFGGDETGAQIRIAGYTSAANISYNLDNSFEATHLGTTVIRQTSPHYCSAEILEAVRSGETVDLFHVKLDAGVLELIENGTLAVIDADAVLAETCRAMLPQITDAVFYQDALCAVPSEIMLCDWEAAAPANARPTTLSELLAASTVIGNAYADTAWSREDYVRYLLEQSIMTHEETPDFASDTFLSYLKQLKAADLQNWAVYTPDLDYSAAVSYTMYGKEEPVYAMLPPTLSAQDEPQVSARMMVYVLNPNSQNKEGAIEYLSYIASHYDDTTAALLCPDQAAGVLFPGFEAIIDEEYAADPPATDRIADILNEPTFWLITDDALAFYRDVLSPHLNLKLEPLLTDPYGWHDSTFPDMVEAVLAYLDGSGTAEECAARLNDLAN
ncbi:MAG TPA: hypothetical protein PK537_05485 [Candidatus Limiplasma sp.]|nr:hypothetical protein [Candidatus Limiplasma sp.]